MALYLSKRITGEALRLLQESGALTIGKLQNRMRISSVDAERVFSKLQKLGVMDAYGKEIKQIQKVKSQKSL